MQERVSLARLDMQQINLAITNPSLRLAAKAVVAMHIDWRVGETHYANQLSFVKVMLRWGRDSMTDDGMFQIICTAQAT